MASFGEIVEPVSRTLWEDWDDTNHDLVNLEWLKSTDVPPKIDSFVLFEGRYLSDYVKLQAHSLELVNSVPGTSVQLFKFNNLNKYMCTIRDYGVVQSTKIIELLKNYLMVSKEVVTVQTKPLPDYHTMTPAQECVIRTVTTTKPVPNTNFSYPKLEQPNIISGVSAGVICWREHMDLSGTAVACYIEYPEDYQISKIQKLLEKFNFSQNANSKPNSVLNSNLYI